jgi:hypothetical protein
MVRLVFALTLFVLCASFSHAAWLDCFKCPTDDRYGPECLANSIPPWPICLFHTASFFVEKSLDGATRCCQEDKSECRCPQKESPKFIEDIDDWCKGVKTCSDSNKDDDDEEDVEKKKHCPTDDQYDPLCLKAAIPPYPICLAKNVSTWVEHAIDGATRCCQQDKSECKCPKKDAPKFLNKIDEWCAGVQVCSIEEGLQAGSIRVSQERFVVPP